MVFGTVFAAVQVAAPAFINAIKRQACPHAYSLCLCELGPARLIHVHGHAGFA